MSQQSKGNIEALRDHAQSLNTLSQIASFSGIIAIPFSFVGIVFGNKALSVGALCWLVSHFVGYITRMIQEDQKRAIAELEAAEAALLAQRSSLGKSIPNRMSLN